MGHWVTAAGITLCRDGSTAATISPADVHGRRLGNSLPALVWLSGKEGGIFFVGNWQSGKLTQGHAVQCHAIRLLRAMKLREVACPAQIHLTFVTRLQL